MGKGELFLISLQEERREHRPTFRTRPLRCPDCGSTAVSRIQRQHFVEFVLGMVRIGPFRCEPCLRRFWAFSLHRRPKRVSPPSSQEYQDDHE